jgi:hypothetical protein
MTSQELKGLAILEPGKRWYPLDKGGRVQCTVSFVESGDEEQRNGASQASQASQNSQNSQAAQAAQAAQAGRDPGGEMEKRKAEEFRRRKAAWKAKKEAES